MKSYSICRRLGMKFGWLRVSEATISANATGGYHFRERDGVWHDTRTDATLEEKLEEAVKALTA